ncbi:hypothetical protein 3 [Hubei rhabdo-like virus 1]|uniref:hypothetical protein 3 n=1 Tax=Hubei rhabdo-like virus 1 TaxID=1923185 RepID=UPI00090C2BBF|nr:hypothetical protein 3 [Hubei rhabdo-like virus 1]APG78708.1 hypothetical protein 3 [Hubei rhabdo-like virus 1]
MTNLIRRFTRSSKANKVDPQNNSPYPPKSFKFTLEHIRAAVALEGVINFDIEGPIEYTVIPYISKRMVAYILRIAIDQHIITEEAATYFDAPLRKAIIQSAPYQTSKEKKLIHRITGVAPVKLLTPVSCKVVADKESLTWDKTTEMIGKALYPVVIRCFGELNTSSFLLRDRGLLRGRMFLSTPIPSPQQVAKTKSAIRKERARALAIEDTPGPSAPTLD